MDLRMLEVFVPQEVAADVEDKIDGCRHLGIWTVPLSGDRALVRALVRTRDSQTVLDRLDFHFLEPDAEARVVLLPVQTALPRTDAMLGDERRPALRVWHRRNQISREELVESIDESASPSTTYVVMVVLAALVAAIGLIDNSPAVIVGAMVIAPLLGPNIALALGTCLGDARLVGRALLAQGIGFATAVAIGVAIGLTHGSLWTTDGNDLLAVPEIALRTKVGVATAVLAMVSGIAGAIAFATGAMSVLIGVMVAVALMPPTVATAMLAGAGLWPEAGRAFLVLITNVVCVNLGWIGAFLAHGIYPSRARWREKRRARRIANIALVVWIVLLALVLVLIAGR